VLSQPAPRQFFHYQLTSALLVILLLTSLLSGMPLNYPVLSDQTCVQMTSLLGRYSAIQASNGSSDDSALIPSMASSGSGTPQGTDTCPLVQQRFPLACADEVTEVPDRDDGVVIGEGFRGIANPRVGIGCQQRDGSPVENTRSPL
jgi:hypothetical protein